MMITGKFIELIGGIQWTNPLDYYGNVSYLLLESSIIVSIGFLLSALFIYMYNKKFYGVDEPPKSWKTIFRGMLLVGIYEVLKIPYTYEWIYGNLFIGMFLIYQVIAIYTLAYGFYLLMKGVSK
ncbi:MAG: hypothetical protein J7K26_00520 [Candidatus Aenigmarchaeota archaeon]|nr:hypothetical protein [Candidatus Aenigmarchaeota archaeon]